MNVKKIQINGNELHDIGVDVKNIEGLFETVGGGDTLTWDGNHDGLENLEGMYCKLSDSTPTLNDLQNDGSITLTAYPNGEINTAQFNFDYCLVDENGIGIRLADDELPVVMILSADNSIGSKGTYFLDFRIADEGVYVSSFTINGYTGFSRKVIKKEYLPSNSPSKIVGSTVYGSGVEIADYNSSSSYLRPLHNSASNHMHLGKDEHRFGDLYLTGKICIGDNNAGTTASTNKVWIGSAGVYVGGTNLKDSLVNSSSTYGNVTLSSTAFRPTINNKVSCGNGTYKWTQLYANTTTISTSDRNMKRNIRDIDDRYIELFDLIEPVAFQFTDGIRIHTGFISQDVEETMAQVGLTAEEVAFFCKDVKIEPVFDENGDWIEDKEVLDDDGNPIYIYSLRYEEYIAIMAEKIKRLESKYNSKLEELDNKLAKVDEKLAQLDSKLNK